MFRKKQHFSVQLSALFIESMSFLWKDFFSVLFFTLKKNAVEIVHELGYFTLRTKNLMKKDEISQGTENE